MKKTVYIMAAGTLLLGSAAFGQTWAEIASGGTNGLTDAGPLLPTANITSGVGPLNRITGTLTGASYPNFVDFDADMFCIRVTDPQAFTATTLTGDTVLALFDINGVALGFNDNRTDSLTSTTSRLDSAWLPTLVAGNDYFIGIARVGGSAAVRRFTRPLGATGGLIFSGPANGGDETIDPLLPDRRADLLAITPGTVLAGWEVQPGGLFLPFNLNYTIDLTGATYSVPAPASFGLLGLGAMAAFRRRR